MRKNHRITLIYDKNNTFGENTSQLEVENVTAMITDVTMTNKLVIHGQITIKSKQIIFNKSSLLMNKTPDRIMINNTSYNIKAGTVSKNKVVIYI